MTSHLRLGLVPLRGEEVILLAGEKTALRQLAVSIDGAIKCRSSLAIHEIAKTSFKFPAALFAVGRPDRPLLSHEFHWPCTSATAERLLALAESDSDAYFEVSRSATLLVSSGAAYGPNWWATNA